MNRVSKLTGYVAATTARRNNKQTVDAGAMLEGFLDKVAGPVIEEKAKRFSNEKDKEDFKTHIRFWLYRTALAAQINYAASPEVSKDPQSVFSLKDSEFSVETGIDQVDFYGLLQRIYEKHFEKAADNGDFEKRFGGTIEDWKTARFETVEEAVLEAQKDKELLDRIQKGLHEEVGLKTAQEFLNIMSMYTRVLVRTGHPTRMTTHAFEVNFDKFRTEMQEELRELFLTGTLESGSDDKKLGKLKTSLGKMIDCAHAPRENLNITKEIRAGTYHSMKIRWKKSERA